MTSTPDRNFFMSGERKGQGPARNRQVSVSPSAFSQKAVFTGNNDAWS